MLLSNYVWKLYSIDRRSFCETELTVKNISEEENVPVPVFLMWTAGDIYPKVGCCAEIWFVGNAVTSRFGLLAHKETAAFEHCGMNILSSFGWENTGKVEP